jgi:hypothetical protein
MSATVSELVIFDDRYVSNELHAFNVPLFSQQLATESWIENIRFKIDTTESEIRIPHVSARYRAIVAERHGQTAEYNYLIPQ